LGTPQQSLKGPDAHCTGGLLAQPRPLDPDSYEAQVIMIKRPLVKVRGASRKGKRSLRASRAVRTRVRETVRLGNTGHVRQ